MYAIREQILKAGFLKVNLGNTNVESIKVKSTTLQRDELTDDLVLELLMDLKAGEGLFIYYISNENETVFWVQHWTPREEIEE